MTVNIIYHRAKSCIMIIFSFFLVFSFFFSLSVFFFSGDNCPIFSLTQFPINQSLIFSQVLHHSCHTSMLSFLPSNSVVSDNFPFALIVETSFPARSIRLLCLDSGSPAHRPHGSHPRAFFPCCSLQLALLFPYFCSFSLGSPLILHQHIFKKVPKKENLGENFLSACMS